MRPMSLAAAALLCLMLSACGGGGGGGGDGGGGGESFNVRLGSSTLTFDYVQGVEPSPRAISATWTGTPPDPVYLSAIVEGDAIDPNIPIQLTQSSANASIRPRVGLAVGEYTGRILFLVCTDSACNNRVGGSPLPISYTVRVGTPLFTPAQPTSFDYTLGSALPAARAVNVAVSDWTATANVPWLRLSATSGSTPGPLSISLESQGMTVGIFSGSVTVTSSGRSQTLSIAAYIRAPDLVVGASQLSFSAFTGEVPVSRPLTISTQNSLAANWTATTNVSWISLSATSGTTPATITVTTPGAISMGRGRYTGDIYLNSMIGGTAKTARVIVQLDLQRPQLSLSSTNLSFAAINGVSIADQSFTVNSTAPTGVVTLAASANAPWIELDRTTGATLTTFTVGANPSIGPLASGNHAGTVQLTATAGVETWALNVPVQLALTRPVLTANPASIELGGDMGRTFDTLPLTLSLNTGAHGYGWSASQSGAGNWLQTTASGVVSAAGATVQLTPDRTGVQPGSHSKSVTFQTQVNGDVLTTTVPVSLNLDTHKLLALENGVAFTSTPGFSRLSRTISVVSNFDRPIEWTATSNQPWLSVTPSGVGGGNIVLTADPAALATDNLYTATVTITAGGSDPVESETIRVGLWKGTVTPSAHRAIPGANFRHALADPIRPYVHANQRDNRVHTFNVYTGQEVLPAIELPTTMAWAMTANTDGSLLWVLSIRDYRLIPIDLETRTVVESQIISFGDNGLGQSTQLAYARPNGVGILLPETGDTYAVTGERLGRGLGYVAFSGDGKKAFNSGLRWDFDYTSAHGGRFTFDRVGGVGISAYAEDVGVSVDGSRVYFGASNYSVVAYDGNTLSQLPWEHLRNARYNNFDVARDGRVVIGCDEVIPNAENLWIYRADGTLVASYRNANGSTGFLEEGIVTFTSDGRFVMVPAGEIEIYPAPQ